MTIRTRPHNSDRPLPYCRVTRVTDLAIANVTGTAITFTARDPGNIESRDIMWDGATALYATEDGIWHVEGSTVWSFASNVGARYIYLVRSGGPVEAISTGSFATNNWYLGSTVSCDLSMNKGEYVQLMVHQSSGGNLSIMPGTTGWVTFMSLQLIQPLRGRYQDWAGK